MGHGRVFSYHVAYLMAFFCLAFFLSFWLSFFLGAMSANPQWIIRDRNKRNKYNNTLLMNVNVGECQRIMCG